MSLADAATLRRAAEILKQRHWRPNRRTTCNLLLDTADAIDDEMRSEFHQAVKQQPAFLS